MKKIMYVLGVALAANILSVNDVSAQTEVKEKSKTGMSSGAKGAIVGGMTFYQTPAGKIVKTKNSITKDRFKKDKAFEGSRDALSEFTSASAAGALIRKAFAISARTAKDWSTHFRLNSAIVAVAQSDPLSRRGKRRMSKGDPSSLVGFEWNSIYHFSSIFLARISSSIDAGTGDMEVLVPAFNPKRMIKAPKGSTHFELNIAGASINPSKKTQSSVHASSGKLSLKEGTADLSFQLQVNAVSGNPHFLGAGIIFYQEVNGRYFPLQEGASFTLIDAVAA